MNLPAAVERATPLLKTLGAAVHHTGAAGSGAAVKLAVNALFGVQVAALAELLGLLEGNGVDLARALEIIGRIGISNDFSRKPTLYSPCLEQATVRRQAHAPPSQ